MSQNIFNNILKYFKILCKTFFMHKYKKRMYLDAMMGGDNCYNCGKKLDGKRRKFCSNTCNQKYWNDVRKGKVKAYYPRIINDKEPTKKELKESNFLLDAHNLAFKGIKFNKETKCMICGIKNVEFHRHHEDYNQADLVIIVCRKCHGFIKKYNHLKELIFNCVKGGKK